MNRGLKRDDKGFTLVELIVVLIILAILAAILVPGLLSYIEDARDKKDMLAAKNCLTLVQTELTKRYAQNSNSLSIGNKAKHAIVPVKNNKDDSMKLGGKLVNATQTDWAFDVLKELQIKKDLKDDGTNNIDGKNDPYCILFGVGSNVDANTGADLHDKYTVYLMLYIENKDSTPLWYFNNEWSTKRPTEIDNNYKITSGAKAGMRLQFYVISQKVRNKSDSQTIVGDNDFMNWFNSLP